MISRTSLLIAGGLLAGALLLYVKKNGSGNVAVDVGTAAGRAVVDAATGTVLGIGDGLGLPRTDQATCDAAMAAGDWLTASLYCGVGNTFMQWYQSPSTPSAPVVASDPQAGYVVGENGGGAAFVYRRK